MHYSIRAARIILANLILYLLTWYFQIPEPEWGLITIWFIMYDYTFVGGVWIKSCYRFLGTLISAIYGLLIIYFFYNNVVINMLAFIPPIFIYAYFFMDTERSYIALIGGVTLSIVLLNHNDIGAAILRVFNVILGIIMSMFMIGFFYPQYAKDAIIKNQLDVLSQMVKTFDAVLDLGLTRVKWKDAQRANQVELNRLVSLFEKNLKEAQHEMKKDPEFWAAYQKEIRVMHTIIGLNNAFLNFVSTTKCHSDERVKNHIGNILKKLVSIQEAMDTIQSVGTRKSIEMKINRNTAQELYSSSDDPSAILMLHCIEQALDELAHECRVIRSFY